VAGDLGRTLVGWRSLRAAHYGRSHHGVGTVDYLIAAGTRLLGARLLTRNVRHLPMIVDLALAYDGSPSEPSAHEAPNARTSVASRHERPSVRPHAGRLDAWLPQTDILGQTHDKAPIRRIGTGEQRSPPR
jgi:hypothetical protein